MWISLEFAKCVMCFFLAVLFHSPYDRWATKRAQFYVCHKITVNRLEMELTIPDILNNVQNTQYRTIDKMMRLRRVALRVWNVTRKKRNNKNKNKNKEEKNYRNTISYVCMCFIYKIDPTITNENGALVLSCSQTFMLYRLFCGAIIEQLFVSKWERKKFIFSYLLFLLLWKFATDIKILHNSCSRLTAFRVGNDKSMLCMQFSLNVHSNYLCLFKRKPHLLWILERIYSFLFVLVNKFKSFRP